MSSCDAVVSLLHRIERAGTTPYDLAGKVWGSWAKELGCHLEVGTLELRDKGVRACWGCGRLEVEGGGELCKECGSRSSFRVETASKEGAVRSTGIKLVDDSLRSLERLEAEEVLRMLVDYILSLVELRSKRKLREETWVSVPLLTKSTTLVLLASSEDEEKGMLRRLQEPKKEEEQWILKGDKCALCGMLSVDSVVVLKEGRNEARICMHRGRGDPAVKRSWSSRSTIEVDGKPYAGGVPMEESNHVSLRSEEWKSKEGRWGWWTDQFTPRDPTVSEEAKAEGDLTGLVLQVGGGQRNAEKIGDWVEGIRPDLSLLQELWELELQTQGWAHKYEVAEGVKGIGQGLAVAVATHVMSPKGELRVLLDVPDVLLVGF